ncbi:hypothetical protein MTR67_038787, partial [Solanum verrucosum]
NLELKIKKCTLKLQIVDANIRDYVPGPEQVSSLHQLSWCESNLQKSIQKVMARKSQQQNMVVDVQQNSTQTFGQSPAQVTLGETSENSLIKFWHVSTWNNNLNDPSQLGLEIVHSNWNNNNSNNQIIQHNDPSSIQIDAITPNVNGFNNSMEENIMENSKYFAETTPENDACKWDDIDAFLNEALNEEDF